MTTKFSVINFVFWDIISKIGFHCNVNPNIPKTNKPRPNPIIVLSAIISPHSYSHIRFSCPDTLQGEDVPHIGQNRSPSDL